MVKTKGLNVDLPTILVGSVLNFVVVAVAGSLLSASFEHRLAEQRADHAKAERDAELRGERRYQVMRSQVDKVEEALDRLADDMGNRIHAIRGLYTAMVKGDPRLEATRWDEYQAAVARWDQAIGGHRCRLWRTLGRDVANDVNNYETDDPSLLAPQSIHGRFFVIHRRLLDIHERLHAHRCAFEPGVQKALADKINGLDLLTDGFTEQMNRLLDQQRIRLQDGQARNSRNPSQPPVGPQPAGTAPDPKAEPGS